MSEWVFVVAAACALGMIVVMVVVAKSCWHAVPLGQALIVNRAGGVPQVSFAGAMVLPIVHRAERIDLAVRQLEIARRGKEGVICRDGIRADIKVTFQVRVNRTVDDIVRVAQSIGCARAADPATLGELFTAKFSEAIKTVSAKLEFEELYSRRDMLKDEILAVIGRDLNGYVLDDLAIDYLEQTPLEVLDPNNVLDSLGIKKILAASQGIAELRSKQRSQAVGNAEPESTLHDELQRLGLLDVRVTTEVSCEVPPGRASLSITLDGNADEVAQHVPSSIPPAVIAAVGRAELTCRDGRVSLAWLQTDVTTEQMIAGARLVHAMRDSDRAYR